MLDSPAFLDITLFKLRALFPFKMQPGFLQRSIYFLADLGTVDFFPHPHDSSLVGAHLDPTLRISLKDLSILRRHGLESLPRFVENGSAMRGRHRPVGPLLTVRLGHYGQRPGEHESRNCSRAY